MAFEKQRSPRSGRIVCRCGAGYGSEYDGKCTRCRKGVTAWEAKQVEEQAKRPYQRGKYLIRSGE